MTNVGSGFFRATLLATSSLVVIGGLNPALARGTSGGRVIVGEATITNPNGYETLITQASNKALIDWTSFSIPAGSIVDFKQPNSSSLTVNRVTGPDASVIDGELLANGAIWLLNSNGILFGRGSQVNVGSLLATTSDISDSDFGDGHYAFSKHSSNPNASVVNQGSIHAATGGSVVLSASHVANEGLIQANLGKVVLGGASAFTVDMVGDNLIRYQITTPVTTAPKGADGRPVASLVSNSGTISAAGGTVVMTASAVKSVQDDVINNSGVIEATSASAKDGEIILNAGPNGTVDDSGTLNVSGDKVGETGGKIEITGNTVKIEGGAKLYAAGYAGGGTVLVGGGFHGKGPIADAANTYVGNATIDVHATEKGDGGRVAIWSNRNTLFAGRINAKGGAAGGNGGFVETSSHVDLQVAMDAIVDASAPHGSKGSWLLDPLNIIIETGGTTQLRNGVLGLNRDGGKTDTIDPSTITTALATTNVTLEAANDITVLNDVVYNSTNSLLLLAEHDIDVYANIQNIMTTGGGGVYLIAGWNGTTTAIGQLQNQGVYGNNGGSIYIGTTLSPGNVSVGSASGTTVAAGDNVTIEADNGSAQLGYAGAGSGNIFVDATGNVTVADLYDLDTGFEPVAQIGNGGLDVTGSISGNIAVQAGGAITIVDDSYATDTNCNNCDLGFSIIGNMGGSKTAGNIVLDAAGAVDVTAEGAASSAQIGNIDLTDGTGEILGNITITAGDVSVLADGEFVGRATIGNSWSFDTTGTVGGNIDITANSLTISSVGGPYSALNQARITNRGLGDVFGNINITTAGDIDLSSTGSGLTEIGDAAICLNGPCSAATHGDITIIAGGALSLISQNGGQSRISDEGGSGNNITVTATGDITLEVTGSGSGNALITDFEPYAGGGDNIDVTSLDGSVQLLADAKNSFAYIGSATNGLDVRTSGNITVSAKNDIVLSATGPGAQAQIGNLGPSSDYATSGNIVLTAGDAIDLGNGKQDMIGNVGASGMVSGSVTLTAQFFDNITATILADLQYGNFTIHDLSNSLVRVPAGLDYSSPYTLTATFNGDVEFLGSVQNSGAGGIDITAAGTVTIGGADASGNVAIGSAGGTTTIEAANLILAADNGYAQLGFDGAGGGDINVTTSGSVTLDGGTGADDFAQIGNGGYQTGGSHSGDITINANGDVTLSGGSGQLAYAQIGNGGAQADQNSSGYTNTGLITVTGQNVVLDAGKGGGSYVQIGNGGYEVGKGLTGAGINSGDISVTAVDSIVLDGNGADAYAQIGNGGDLVNLDATSSASGGDTGTIKVTVTSTGGSVTMAAGVGDRSYVQIGDGGYAENGPNATAADFTTGGDITVTATNVSLAGSDSGSDAYAQIGNGDAAMGGDADVDGNITVNGTTNTKDGGATGAVAFIGNATGTGTVNGTEENGGTGTEAINTVTALVQFNSTAMIDLLYALYAPQNVEQPEFEAQTESTIFSEAPSPLEQMAKSGGGDSSYEGDEPSDHLAASLGKSLDPARGRKKNAYAIVRTLIPGVLKQMVSYTAHNPHGVPPADEDYSNWGNRALWR